MRYCARMKNQKSLYLFEHEKRSARILMCAAEVVTRFVMRANSVVADRGDAND